MDLDFWPRQNVYNVPVLDHSLIYNKIYATSYTPARHIYTQQYWYMSSNNNNNNIILVLKNIPPSQVKVWELRQTNWVPSATESKFWEQRVRNLRSSSAEANWESKFSKISSVTDLPPSLPPSCLCVSLLLSHFCNYNIWSSPYSPSLWLFFFLFFCFCFSHHPFGCFQRE